MAGAGSAEAETAQHMLKTCEMFTKASNIMFSTDEDPKKSKSKAIYVVRPRGAKLQQREVPEPDFWRIGFLQKLLSERLLANYAADTENRSRLEGLVSSLVQN